MLLLNVEGYYKKTQRDAETALHDKWNAVQCKWNRGRATRWGVQVAARSDPAILITIDRVAQGRWSESGTLSRRAAAAGLAPDVKLALFHSLILITASLSFCRFFNKLRRLSVIYLYIGHGVRDASRPRFARVS